MTTATTTPAKSSTQEWETLTHTNPRSLSKHLWTSLNASSVEWKQLSKFTQSQERDWKLKSLWPQKSFVLHIKTQTSSGIRTKKMLRYKTQPNSHQGIPNWEIQELSSQKRSIILMGAIKGSMKHNTILQPLEMKESGLARYLMDLLLRNQLAKSLEGSMLDKNHSLAKISLNMCLSVKWQLFKWKRTWRAMFLLDNNKKQLSKERMMSFMARQLLLREPTKNKTAPWWLIALIGETLNKHILILPWRSHRVMLFSVLKWMLRTENTLTLNLKLCLVIM